MKAQTGLWILLAAGITAHAQVPLTPDLARILNSEQDVTATPMPDGRVSITSSASGQYAGTLEVAAPVLPATAVISEVSSQIVFPVQVFRVKQNWTAYSIPGLTPPDPVFTVFNPDASNPNINCVSRGRVRDDACNVNFLRLEGTGASRKAYVDTSISFGAGGRTVNLRFYWRLEATAEDRVSFSNRSLVKPDAGTAIPSGSPALFLAIVLVQLQTRASADLVLELRDQSGALLAQSSRLPITRATDPSAYTRVIDENHYLLNEGIPSSVKGLSLQAVLYDGAAKLSQSVPIEYTVTLPPDVSLSLGVLEGQGLVPTVPDLAQCGNYTHDALVIRGAAFERIPANAVFQAVFFTPPGSVFDPDERARVELFAITKTLGTGGVDDVRGPFSISEDARPDQPVRIPYSSVRVYLSGNSEVRFLVKVTLRSGRQFTSNHITIPVDCVYAEDPTVKRIPAGRATELSVPVSWVQGPASLDVLRCVIYGYIKNGDLQRSGAIPIVPTPEECSRIDIERSGSKIDSFSLTPPFEVAGEQVSIVTATITYKLRALGVPKTTSCRISDIGVFVDTRVMGGLLTNAVRSLIGNASTATEKTVSQSAKPASIRTVLQPANGKPGAGADRTAASAYPYFVGINFLWLFDPGIPRDGSFSADLTLFYEAGDLPADPTFAESKLEMVSYDPATGVLERVPSQIDLATKAVTARVDWLAPYYSLAVFGTPTRNTLAAPALSAGGGLQAGLTAVNPESSAVAVSISAFAPDPVPASFSLAAGQQISGVLSQLLPSRGSTAADWLVAQAGARTVAAQLVVAGPAFDVLELQRAASVDAVFPGVLRDALVSTEFHIANPSTSEARGSLDLYSADGQRVASMPLLLPGSGKRILRVQDILPGSFTGYARLRSNLELYATAVLQSQFAIAALNAQSLPFAASATGRLFAPYLGPEEATLNLVNAGDREARLTIRGYQESGAPTARPSADVIVGPGQQYRATLSEIFGAGTLPRGSVVVDSDTTGILGDLIIVAQGALKVTAMQLSAEPLPSSLIPYIANDSTFTTNLVIGSTGSAANAVVSAYRANGSTIGTAQVRVAANGRSSQALSSFIAGTAGLRGGYIRIDSDQPVVTYADVASTVSDGAIIVGQSAPSSGAVAPTPPASGSFRASPTSLAFNDVNVGLSHDLSVTVFNETSSRVGVTRLTFSSDRFSAPAFSAFTLEPNTSREILVRFSPNAAVSSTANVTIVTDPTSLTLTVALSGRGIGGTTGGGGSTGGGTTTTSTLQVDDGTDEFSIGFPQGGVTGYFVNRLTPTSYPSTLRAVQILFPAGEVANGTAITVIAANHASGTGGTSLTGLNFQRTSSSVPSVGSFVEIPVTPITIQSGDFVVGFSILNSVDSYPVAVDTSSSRQRSYLSTDGTGFRLLDSVSGATPGNFLIRARVDSGSGGGNPPPPAASLSFDPASLNFAASEVGLTKVVRVINNTASTVTILGASSSNPSFVIASTFPAPTGPGSFNNIVVRFSPTATGTQSAVITLTTNPPISGASFTVTGTNNAAPASFSFDPTALTFSASEVGQTKFVRAINNSPSTVTITAVTSSNPSFVSVTALPAPTGAGSFNTIGIRFSPTVSGTQTGTITLTTNPPISGSTFTVTGTSNAPSGGGGGGSSAKITTTTAAGWPNGRLSNNLPPNAIDGSTATFTWTTESFNAANPSYLGIGFGTATTISRIRLYKDNDAGGPGLIAKNLTIEYTTSPTTTALASRTWQPVSGLINGYQGSEMMIATGVNTNGTVTADNHNSLVNGWASLSFTPVNATGIRVAFTNATPLSINHYRVYEFEVYGDGGTTTPPPGGPTPAGCPSNTNIALRKPASQSTTAFNGPASAGNNGVLEPDYGLHTDEEINPWWQVDLGQPSTVCQVRMFNRMDPGYQDRARSISVLASDDGITFRTIYRHDNTPWGAGGVPLTPAITPFTARFVRLRLEANQRLYFNLREVEVYWF